MTILPFDEINALSYELRNRFPNGLKQEEREDIIDEMLDLFLLAYARGKEVTSLSFPSEWKPKTDDVMRVVDKPVAGETWRDRVDEWFDNGGTADDIIRIVETESHRIANESAIETAQRGGATQKTWATMLDDRVRETHDYLEGVTVGIDDDFITYDGDKAQAPGLFDLPENNINCRCELIFS